MKNKPVLVVDSGIGGLTVLYDLVKKEPNCDYIFFADNLNAPYGNKSPAFVRNKMLENLHMLCRKYKPQTIVIACNTATAVSINTVRKIFSNLTVVGTEPAIKTAFEENKKNILVLATPNTIKHNKLLKEYKSNENLNLNLLQLPNLAMDIERNIDNLNILQKQIKDILSKYIGQIDAIVLGCTHYIYLKPILRKICSTDIKIYDGNNGVCQQTLKNIIRKNKQGKIFVLTNKISAGGILISAWNYLQKQGVSVCAE